MRFVMALLLAATFAAVATPDSLAVRFADTPCIETGESRSRVCPAAIVGEPYLVHLTGEGGCGPALPYQFRLLLGSLPPGLMLDQDGRLHGTPRKAGTWSFWLELSDEDPPSADWCLPKKSEREFVVAVGAPPATVGSPYAVQVAAQGTGAQTWSIASGTLPAGLSLGPTTGVIAGKPATTGAFPLKLSVTDERGAAVSVDLTIVVYPQLALATKRLVSGMVGRSYRATIRASGGVRPVTFTVLAGRLPTGIRLNTTTGVLSGKPRKAGIFRVTIEAGDRLHRAARQTYVLSVSPRHP
jgi:Putative Ig domain